MFWPLIVGFIAFILVAVFMGWLMDPSRHGDRDRH
jgi:F0F1-type ATP synthase assembly protein I